MDPAPRRSLPQGLGRPDTTSPNGLSLAGHRAALRAGRVCACFSTYVRPDRVEGCSLDPAPRRSLPRRRARRRSKDVDGDRPDIDLAADRPRTARAPSRRRTVLGASGDASTREKRDAGRRAVCGVDLQPTVRGVAVESARPAGGPGSPPTRLRGAGRVPRDPRGAARTPDDPGGRVGRRTFFADYATNLVKI